jgi:hypothetical protein
MFPLRRAVVAVTTLLVATQLGWATPAWAARGITVTPSTDLIEGQQVTVTGSDFSPNALIGICEGVVSATPSRNDCSYSQKTGRASTSGDFSLSLTALQQFTTLTLGREVHCWVENICVVLAAEIDESSLPDINLIPGTAVYSAPLTFLHVQPDLRIRRLSDDAIRFDDQYLSMIKDEWAVNTTTPPRNFSYAIQVQNDGNVTDALTVRGFDATPRNTVPSPDISVRYFCAWQDVTSQVLSETGFTFPHMPPGAFGKLSLQFLVSANAPVDAKSHQAIAVTSGLAPHTFLEDAIHLGVRVVAP